jgi:uncharacterized protein YqgC (DUF456 family)
VTGHDARVNGFEILLGLVMLVGLIGVLVPVLPGLLLIAAAAVVWALVERPGPWGWAAVAVIAVIAILGIAAPTWLSGRRATAAGLPGWVLLAGVAGAVAGFFLIPVVGALIGWPVGVFVAELVRHRHPGPAWASTKDALKGMGVGVAVQFVAGVAMIALWAAAVLAT